jgi:Na+-transporting methylmalonyl-CoA/oxaloacetate decarboxylase gamma subunit
MTMNAIVPDTFQGAVILSVIDFFLSFLIISGIGFVLSMFPLLNKVAGMFGGHKTHAAKSAKPAERKHEASRPVVVQPPLGDMAAIAAAVAVVMDGTPHRIINIEPNQGNAWVQGGRMAQHGSHSKVR